MLVSFLTGMFQVLLVVYQTKQISRGARLWSIALVGGAISTVWVFNVRAAVGTTLESVAYVAGATVGTTLAMLIPAGRRDG